MKKLSALVFLLTSASASAFAGSHYDVLKDKYLNGTNNSITKEDLQGVYLGRCFQSSSDTPIGMVLLTRKSVTSSTQDPDNGPDFPPVTNTTESWKMAMILLTSDGTMRGALPASDNDDYTPEQAKAFWNDPSQGGIVPKMEISTGVASMSGDGSGSPFEIKRGNDGLLYGLVKNNFSDSDQSALASCYFFKKLF